MRKLQETKLSFEEIYPHYPFGPLVGLAVALAEWLVGRRKRRDDALCGERRPSREATPADGSDLTAVARRRQDDLAA